MKYINTFKTHASYEEKLNGGGVDISLPNVSYCEDVKDVHYTPYNLVRFYVGEITGTTQPTVKIYTDSTYEGLQVSVKVSEGNKWYSYLLPKDKGLYKIEGDSVKKVVVKADINIEGNGSVIPSSTIEVSFKGSNLSKKDTMAAMFIGCTSLTSLDVSNFDTSKVTNMAYMFYNCKQLMTLILNGWNMANIADMNYMFSGCTSLNKIKMVGCSKATIDKIKAQLENDKITGVTIVTE